MRRLLVVICCMCCSLLSMAQEQDLERMNQIKLDTAYLYGEATMKTQFEASATAREDLTRQISKWAEAQKLKSGDYISDVSDNLTDSVVVKRANMMRVLVYVKKSALLLAPSAGEQTTLDKILGVTSFFKLKEVMEPLYNQGVIKSFGKYATMTEPQDCYLVIYDPDGDIRAVLGKGIASRKNLSTGNDDSEHNYSGCGAIWFQLNEEE